MPGEDLREPGALQALLRGDPEVPLGVEGLGGERREVVLHPEVVLDPTVRHARFLDTERGLGYLAIRSFSHETPREFDPEGGEMGIYTTTGSFTTADLMRAFVSWGNVIPQREATASAGGYWAYGDRIQGTEDAAGFVIVGESNRADGYQAVRAACLAAPPNRAP